MAKFVYNNTKNTSIIGQKSFELNSGYYSWVSYKKYIDLWSESKSVEEIFAKLRELILVYYDNLF